MKVLKVEPHKAPCEIEISGDLESMQHEVGGYIEAMYPSSDMIGIVCNEEGKINGMELNRSVLDDEGRRIDVIAGTFLVVGLGEDNFDSLPDDLMQKYKDQFQYAECFMLDANTKEILSFKYDTETGEPVLSKGRTHSEPDRAER